MNYNMQSKKTGCAVKTLETAAQYAVDFEITLPDYCPEIQRVLKCIVEPNVISTQFSDSGVTVGITSVARVIFVGDNGKLCCYEHSVNGDKRVDTNGVSVSAENTCALAVTDYVNCRAVSPRRVDVHAMINVGVTSTKLVNDEILCCADGAGLQVNTREREVFSCAGCVEKTFPLSEVAEIKDSLPAIFQILGCNAVALIDDKKIISNKLLIKGDLKVRIHYIGEDSNAPDCFEHTMPISQIIELDGISEDCMCALESDVISVLATPKADTSGKMRIVDINARVNVGVTAGKVIPLTLIGDAYSTEYEIKADRSNAELFSYVDTLSETFTAKTTLDSPDGDVKSIVAVWCNSPSATSAAIAEGILFSGTYKTNIIYKNAADEYAMICMPVSFEHKMKLAQAPSCVKARVKLCVLESACAVTADGKLDLRAEISARGLVLSSGNEKYVSNIVLDTDCPKKKDSAALTVYFCDSGESVWNIAKRYNTTPDAIMKENSLDNGTVEEKRMLMIPCV